MSKAPPPPSPPQQQRSPLGQSLVASRSISFAVLGLLGATALGWYVLSHHAGPAPKSAPVGHPEMAAPAGGDNHSEVLDSTARQKEEEDAKKALAQHTSYAGALTTRSKIGDDTAPDLGKAPGATKPTGTSGGQETSHQEKPAAPAGTVPNPFTRNPLPAGNTHQPPADRPPARGSLSEQAEATLIAAWTGGGPSLDLRTSQGDTAADGTGPGNGQFARAPVVTGSPATAAAQAVPAAAPAAKSSRRLLLPAGRGVYGHAVLTANSDIGGEALVEIDSGPLIHARVSGTFQRKDERLVIKFDKLMIGDADPVTISAFAVSPDTAETGVASEVHEHIASRMILPAAAAFVEGLGNAMQNSNTTSYTAGLGLQSFTHLTLPQQMGVAAGRAGQEFGQILQQQTPQQPTVLLNAGDPVGVLFDEPVYAP